MLSCFKGHSIGILPTPADIYELQSAWEGIDHIIPKWMEALFQAQRARTYKFCCQGSSWGLVLFLMQCEIWGGGVVVVLLSYYVNKPFTSLNLFLLETIF